MELSKRSKELVQLIKDDVSRLDGTLSAVVMLLEDVDKERSYEPIKLKNFIGLTAEEKDELVASSKDPVIVMLLTEQKLIEKNTNNE